MEEIKESRDAAATTTETKLPESPPTLPPSHVGPTILPLEAAVLGKAHSSPVHHDLMIAHPYHHPHSPTASRKGIELFSGVPYGGRARSASLGTAYTETPLLVPTSPPPRGSALLLSGGRQKVLSLSPNLHRGETTAGSGGGHHLPVSLLGVPSMVEPPRLSDTQKAMEAAVQAERKRNKEMEQDEKNMTAEELRAVLKRERHRMSRFAADLARLRSAAVQCQAEAEIHEEGRINGLMRRLESLQIEKGRIIVELEREEEMLTNTLQKKLNEVRREKAQLEQIIAHEQSSHSESQSKVTGLPTNKADDNDVEENPLGSVKPINNNSLLGLRTLSESPEEEGENEDTEGGVPMES